MLTLTDKRGETNAVEATNSSYFSVALSGLNSSIAPATL